MTRGNSLEEDLRLLVNNSKYSDIEILCKDKTLHSSRAILAARSEVFEGLLYNGMKESYEKQISFPTINSLAMEIVLEFIYTGSVKKKSLTKNNMVEAFYAADYFQLQKLQDLIFKHAHHINKDLVPELLSKVVDMMPLSEDNILLDLFVKVMTTIPLNKIEFGQLSITALRYFLSYTYEKKMAFMTPEYEVFRYSAIMAAKQVSNDAYRTITEQLPSLEQIENLIQVENRFIPDQQKISRELKPLIKFIDFGKIKGEILVDIIEPLDLIPAEIVVNIYRQKTKSNNSDLNDYRGITGYIWDELTCGSKLLIEDNGKVIQALNNCYGNQDARAKIELSMNGIYSIFEWDVIIEKGGGNPYDPIYIGVCSSEYYDYESYNFYEFDDWLLSSAGTCLNNSVGNCEKIKYCPPFGDGTKITVHLDMNKRTCAFTVNGKKYPEVSNWNNLPLKLYPIVRICSPSRLRIQPHQIDEKEEKEKTKKKNKK